MDNFSWVAPILVALISLAVSILTLRSQRKVNEATAAEKITAAAARSVEIDSKRIEDLLCRVSALEKSNEEKDKVIEQQDKDIKQLKDDLEKERSTSNDKLIRQQAQIDLLTKQVIALGGRPITLDNEQQALINELIATARQNNSAS